MIVWLPSCVGPSAHTKVMLLTSWMSRGQRSGSCFQNAETVGSSGCQGSDGMREKYPNEGGGDRDSLLKS